MTRLMAMKLEINQVRVIGTLTLILHMVFGTPPPHRSRVFCLPHSPGPLMWGAHLGKVAFQRPWSPGPLPSS